MAACVSFATTVVGAVQAVREAQGRLDERLVHGPEVAWAIPRVTLGAQFSLRAVEGRTALIFGHASEQEQSSSVDFTLLLAPEPPPACAPAAAPTPATYLPPFIETPEVVAQIVFDLCLELEALDPKGFRDEVGKLRAAAANQDDDPGLVALRLAGGDAYLVARIGGRRDGIFLFDRASTTPLTVYSHWRSSGDELPWAPFHRLFETFRLWQRGLAPARRLDAPMPDAIGGIEVRDFLLSLWTAYTQARQLLATPAPQAARTLPAHYELGAVSAKLSYSVPREVDTGRDAGPPFIRSDLVVTVGSEAGTPAIRMDLRAPEYILVDDQRQAVLDLLRANVVADPATLGDDSFFHVVAPGFEDDYAAALLNPSRARNALVFLSYVDKPPKNRFLFVFTGTLAGAVEERDFAFRFELDDDRLVKPEMVMRLEGPPPGSLADIELPPFDAATVPYNKHAAGLHDLFHAIWIWTLAGGWFPVLP